MTQKKEVVLNSVAEFLGIWTSRGEASLSLNTTDRVTRAVESDLKKSNKSRMPKSFLSDFLTGRKPLLI